MRAKDSAGVDNSLEERIISISELALHSMCSYAYYLHVHEGKNRIPKTGYAALSLLFKSKRKRLFEVGDFKQFFEGARRAGPNLIHINKMSSEELEEYLPASSAEAFGNTLQGIWNFITSRKAYAGSPLVWFYNGEDWTLGNTLNAAGREYYNFLVNNGAPIMGVVDKERTIKFKGNGSGSHLIKVKIPEIRTTVTEEGKQIIYLDNPGIWGYQGEYVSTKKASIKDSALVTLNLLGLSKLLKKYPLYHQKFNLSYETSDEINNSEAEILPNLRFRHINLTKNIEDEYDEEGRITITDRADNDLDSLKTFIDNFVDDIRGERFDPNYKNCGVCMYNLIGIDGNQVCPSRNKNKTPAVLPEYFKNNKINLVEIEKEPVDEKYIVHLELIVERERLIRNHLGDVVQKIPIPRKVATMDFELVSQHEDLAIFMSDYKSDVFGIRTTSEKQGSYEMRMIRKADEILQREAERMGIEVLHRLDFKDQFNFAGKGKTRELLFKLGYKIKMNKIKGELFEKSFIPEQH